MPYEQDIFATYIDSRDEGTAFHSSRELPDSDEQYVTKWYSISSTPIEEVTA